MTRRDRHCAAWQATTRALGSMQHLRNSSAGNRPIATFRGATQQYAPLVPAQAGTRQEPGKNAHQDDLSQASVRFGQPVLALT